MFLDVRELKFPNLFSIGYYGKGYPPQAWNREIAEFIEISILTNRFTNVTKPLIDFSNSVRLIHNTNISEYTQEIP